MKRFLVLDSDQVSELGQLLKSEKRVKIYRRLQFIQMKHEGKKNSEIMKIIPVSSDTLSNWLTLFLSSGFPGLCGLKYEGRRPGKLTENIEATKKYVNENLISNISSLKDWIQKELSITVETSWLGEWCKKNSIILTRK